MNITEEEIKKTPNGGSALIRHLYVDSLADVSMPRIYLQEKNTFRKCKRPQTTGKGVKYLNDYMKCYILICVHKNKHSCTLIQAHINIHLHTQTNLNIKTISMKQTIEPKFQNFHQVSSKSDPW